jgi:hypothetical protein
LGAILSLVGDEEYKEKAKILVVIGFLIIVFAILILS